MDKVTLSTAALKSGRRTLATIKNKDATIEDSDENVTLVLALRDLGVDRITAATLKNHKSKIKVEEAISRVVHLVKRNDQPTLLGDFKQKGFEKYIIPETEIRTKLDKNLFWFVDKAIPGGQNTVGYGAFEHQVALIFSDTCRSGSPAPHVERIEDPPQAAASSETQTPEPKMEISPAPSRRLKPYVSDSDFPMKSSRLTCLQRLKKPWRMRASMHIGRKRQRLFTNSFKHI